MGSINPQLEAEAELLGNAELDVQIGLQPGILFTASEWERAGTFIKTGPKTLFDNYRDQPKYNQHIHLGWLLG